MDFLRVVLQTAAAGGGRVVEFYEQLGLERTRDAAVRIGAAQLELVAGAGEPFYHFALLVPGDRFDAALEWARERTELLPDPETGEAVFDFDNWDAKALYFHDPAGNIVELIAHRGIGERGADGPFSASELLGFSELGLVGEVPELARELDSIDLRLWDGTLDEPGRLAFVGERARTLILSPEGRGWLPTGRPAEAYAVEAVVSGAPAGEVRVGAHTVVRSG